MKLSFLIITMSLLLTMSCKKEQTCDGCTPDNAPATNHPPVANAGRDQFLSYTNKTTLDGSGSFDPDNDKIFYKWKRISGPRDFFIVSSATIKTELVNLVEGIYEFELTVTDAAGLYSTDTVQIATTPPSQPQNLDNVFFYCPDPTSTTHSIWQSWDSGGISQRFIIVTVDSMTKSVGGVWGNGYAPRCPVQSDYNAEPDVCAGFNLSPGTYHWSAENAITDFRGWPETTSQFVQFFSKVRKAEGTFTVLPGEKCLLQPIKF